MASGKNHEGTCCIPGCRRSRAPSKSRCSLHMENQRTKDRTSYRDRVLRGQCVFCQSSAAVGAFCFTHWFKNVGVPHGLGSKKGAAILQQLWEEQVGCCAVTGEKLIPGLNASLDHIIPKSRGGSSDKSNLRWVLLRVNQLKWDMTHEEFVEMCRLVVRAQAKQDVGTSISQELYKRSN